MKTPHDARTPVFDPFADRLSRDIRNGLSRAFGEALATGSLSPVEELGASLLARDLAACHREYVTSRLERYRLAFDLIRNSRKDQILQGLILWDLKLFFEVHELLEHAWHQADSSRRSLLQALIRAAGVYVKLEHGHVRQAAGLAEKACDVLESNRDVLRSYFAPEKLIAALRALDPNPPRLLSSLSASDRWPPVSEG